jgi:hypothetical protein
MRIFVWTSLVQGGGIYRGFGHRSFRDVVLQGVVGPGGPESNRLNDFKKKSLNAKTLNDNASILYIKYYLL